MLNILKLFHLKYIYIFSFQGLAETKIVGSSSRFSPISVLRVPSQPDLTQAYSQHSLHRSVSQLIDRKSLMMEEGSWDNPLGQDSGLVRKDNVFMLDYSTAQFYNNHMLMCLFLS